MQNLFINENDEFTIAFSVAIDSKDVIFCDIERKSLVSSLESMGKESTDYVIEDYQATFKKPSFGDISKLYDSILTGDNGAVVNPIEIKFRKISALIKSWNLKGDEIAPTPEDIRSLHPTIATAISLLIDVEIGNIFI